MGGFHNVSLLSLCFHDVSYTCRHTFTYVAHHPEVDDEHFQLLERFNIILYDKASDLQHIDEARKELFCQKGKTMERLPPTQDALLQHVKRVAYLAGIWCTSELTEQHAPSPDG